MNASPSVLVIESDAALSSLLTALLQREGFGVNIIPHGASALRLIEEQRCQVFAAIVIQLTPFASPVDPSVPTGVALVRRLAEASPQCLPKTLVLTTFQNQDTAKLREICTVMTEPFEIAEFMQTIKTTAGPPLSED
jgi:DNA-binding response OmpR family regulator